jgi:endonuclease YncB( thermonuclease family)
MNVNVELVRRGAATVGFYDGERGKYAAKLFAAARQARAERRGFWGACKAV